MTEFREFIAKVFYYADILEIFIGGTRKVGNSIITICDDIQKTQRAIEIRNNRNLSQK